MANLYHKLKVNDSILTFKENTNKFVFVLLEVELIQNDNLKTHEMIKN